MITLILEYKIKDNVVIISRVGKDYSGQELGAERNRSDMHDTPIVTILQSTVSKR